MKKLLLGSMMMMTAAAQAQTVIDTVAMGNGYATNKWYSLQNDEVDSSAANNWDIALAATASMTADLTTSLLINQKVVTLYEATGVLPNPTDFAGVTAFDNTWPQLHNRDTSWAVGAFNTTTPPIGTYDYGWGSYDMNTHRVEANRVFVLGYGSSVYRKMYITLDPNTTAKYYILTHANLDNSDLHVDTIHVTPYSTKNFVYFSLSADSVLDREPASADWDILFTQYTDGTILYPVTGILHNVGVEVMVDSTVADVNTFENWVSPNYSSYINSIGYNWKALVGMSYAMNDSTVYFVKAVNGDVWKMVMTGFMGSSAGGQFMFSKKKLVTASVTNTSGVNESSMSVYPNPSNGGDVKLIYNLNSNNSTAKLMVTDMTGRVVLVNNLDNQKGMHQYPLQTQNLAAGTYIINVMTDAGAMQQKLTIQ